MRDQERASMLVFPKKRIWSLVGVPRVGKGSLAQYLVDTRGFTALAFADQVKEEYGISKEEFESAKIAENIEELRQKLWDFSAKIKAKDPLHFISGVMEKAVSLPGSVVITDIRTQDELNAFYNYKKTNDNRRVYFISDGEVKYEDVLIPGTKLSYDQLFVESSKYDLRTIINPKKGLYYFYQDLDRLFFQEDIKDLLSDPKEKVLIEKYVEQFEVKTKKETK